jgi:hypothetical protein
MKTVVFEYQGARYETLKQIAEVRGVKQVNRRDFERLGITEIELPDAPAADGTQAAPTNPEPPKAPETPEAPATKPDEPKATDKDDTLDAKYPNQPEQPTNSAATDNKEAAPEAAKGSKVIEKINEQKEKALAEAKAKAEPLQKKYGYADVNHLGAELKKMDAAAVIALAKEIGVTWKEDAHPGINRMRAAMAIRAAMFPGERRERAPKSSWKNIELEELIKLAKKHKLKYRETIDDKITRMWVIKALNDAGITPPQK